MNRSGFLLDNDTQQHQRIYQAEDQRWYFQARDRKLFGPFDDEQEAGRALARHVRDCEIRDSLAYRFGWPRRWNPMRFARRSDQRHSAAN